MADMLISLYQIKLGTKKWYHHIVYYCISIAVIKGWILYKCHVTQNGVEKKQIMSLLDFQSRIAGSSLQEKKPGPGRHKSDTTMLYLDVVNIQKAKKCWCSNASR